MRLRKARRITPGFVKLQLDTTRRSGLVGILEQTPRRIHARHLDKVGGTSGEMTTDEEAIDRDLPIDGSNMFNRARRLAYRFGITPGALSGQPAIVRSSTLRCCATSFGGVCVSQLESETSS
jgi:hypothetical protein